MSSVTLPGRGNVQFSGGECAVLSDSRSGPGPEGRVPPTVPGVVAAYGLPAALGVVGVWFSFRAGLRAGTSTVKVASCLGVRFVSVAVLVFALAMIVSSRHGHYLLVLLTIPA